MKKMPYDPSLEKLSIPIRHLEEEPPSPGIRNAVDAAIKEMLDAYHDLPTPPPGWRWVPTRETDGEFVLLNSALNFRYEETVRYFWKLMPDD